MISCGELMHTLAAGEYDTGLTLLYARNMAITGSDKARDRIEYVVQNFMTAFNGNQNTPVSVFSTPGRTEIGGNHTDHQHGHVLCASVDLDMLACAAPNDLRVIRISSEGYPRLEIALDDLQPRLEEKNTSLALVRGVAARITELGYSVEGFDAFITSDVLTGSGLSSSAAYEVLLGNIINHFSCNDKLDAVEIAKIGQYAENTYFGKPCGLMDQIACSVGGVVAVDFTDPASPQVQKVAYDFGSSGHKLCIVDTGSCHADLTDDYADITREMGAVAAYFNKTVLREVSEKDFNAAVASLRERCGDRAVLRAMHYFEDDFRATQEAAALQKKDFAQFLALVNESGLSSALNLQNTWSIANPKQQAIPLALAKGRKLLNGAGAIRVHGGGFAGTIQAFVPEALCQQFKSEMEKLLGAGSCHILCIRPVGGCVVIG